MIALEEFLINPGNPLSGGNGNSAIDASENSEPSAIVGHDNGNSDPASVGRTSKNDHNAGTSRRETGSNSKRRRVVPVTLPPCSSNQTGAVTLLSHISGEGSYHTLFAPPSFQSLHNLSSSARLEPNICLKSKIAINSTSFPL